MLTAQFNVFSHLRDSKVSVPHVYSSERTWVKALKFFVLWQSFIKHWHGTNLFQALFDDICSNWVVPTLQQPLFPQVDFITFISQTWIRDKCYSQMPNPPTIVLQINTTAEFLTNRGVIHEFMGQQQNAMTDYQAAISLDPKYSLAYFNAGNIYFRHRQFSQAMCIFHSVFCWH